MRLARLRADHRVTAKTIAAAPVGLGAAAT